MNPILQHIVGNWKSSVQSLLTGVIALGTYFAAVPSTVIPQQTAIWITVAVGAAKVLLGLLENDAKPEVTSSVTINTTAPTPPAAVPPYNPAKDPRIIPLILLILALGLAGSASAQAPSTSNGLVVSSDAAGCHYQGSWSPCTRIAELYDFIDFGTPAKNNHIYLSGIQLVDPSNFSAYFGGARIQPDLTALFNHTNVTPGSFQPFIDGGIGVGSVTGGNSKFSYTAGGGATLDATTNVSFQLVEGHYSNIAGNQVWDVSAGVLYKFIPSPASVAKSQARKLAKAQALYLKGR